MVVYVFCENDLGDQIEEIKNSNSIPYAEIDADTVVINDNLFLSNINKRISIHRMRKYIFYHKSILLQTIYTRFKMLRQYGINLSADESDFKMSGQSDKLTPPNQNDLPSSWDSNYKQRAIVVCEAVISKWFNDVKQVGKEFVILYIPRESEWKKNDGEQDSWKYWLKTFCNINGINFIDPTKYFSQYDIRGIKIYDDNFSENGHVAFAESFIDWYKKSMLEQ